MGESVRCQFNFTAGSAIVQESITVADSFIANDEDWNKTEEAVDSAYLLLRVKSASARRLLNLIISRLKLLTDEQQLRLLTMLPNAEKRLVVLLAIVKKYGIVVDFITHTVRVKYVAPKYRLSPKAHNSKYTEGKFKNAEICFLQHVKKIPPSYCFCHAKVILYI